MVLDFMILAMAFVKEFVRNERSLWQMVTRAVSTSRVLFITHFDEDKPIEPVTLKDKTKLPSPHKPVKYPNNWKFPQHNLSEESIKNYEPSKLLMVRRVAPLGFTMKWEKYILAQLRIHDDTEHLAIVKNSPLMNLKLFKIKHLIQVKPITFPNGLPEKGDYSGCYLTKNGEFIVNKKLKVDENDFNFPKDYARKRMDDNYLRDHLRLKWQQKIDLLHND